ncbi:MAG: NBR1-Ig-like domain-containing protein [Deltaproteobacteria bacterium]|nr:NBR1-Ig-like domain-containing protein [Deltaproteobacteria bacterium]
MLTPSLAVRRAVCASVATLSLLVGSCAPVDEGVGFTVQEVAVSTLRGRAGCTTAGAEGLSAQLLDEVLCLSAGALVSYAPNPGITLTNPRVHAVLAPAARDAILRAAARTPLRINSGYRTLVEQWLLWTAAGCGLVATPGSSNHETGRAVDVDNWSAARSALTANGFVQSYPTNDPVHFDGPGMDFRATSVRAFQRLWNANNPTDRISEDGSWGPMTQSRLERSPAEGFRIGRVCGMSMMTEPRLRAQFVSQTFPTAATPIALMPGQTQMGAFELRNTGTEPWVAGRTFIATTQPRDRVSALAHSSWTANNRVATVSATVMPGATGRFEFTLQAPMAPGDYAEFFGMVHTGVGWFSDPGQGGPPDNQLQLRVRVGRAAFGATLVSNTCETTAVMAPQSTRMCTITLRNTGSQTWSAMDTFLATSEPRDHESALADLTWVNPARVLAMPSSVAPGESVRLSFAVRAPSENGEYTEYVNLFDERGGWFSDMANDGPTDTTLALRATVTAGSAMMDASVPTDASEFSDGSTMNTRDVVRPDAARSPGQPLDGGCGCSVPTRAKPHATALSLAALMVLVGLRRRR